MADEGIAPESRQATGTAVALSLTSPVAWSMTRRQLAVFETLCRLQMADAGPHSLLPNVMEALLAVARCPWWDAAVAGVADEPSPETST